jgi:hypothetical protein
MGDEGITRAEVTGLVRDVVAALAPEELPLLDTVADTFWAEASRRPKRPHGATVGFGVEAVLLSQLAFPIISGALGDVLGTAATQLTSARRRRSAAVHHAGAGPGQDANPNEASRAARPGLVLTATQAKELGAQCEQHARTLGLPADKAKLLAAAVLGSALVSEAG